MESDQISDTFACLTLAFGKAGADSDDTKRSRKSTCRHDRKSDNAESSTNTHIHLFL